ncbi:LOW QUALITY PROTEIN: cortactin-binding protein 2-like [Megalops cyprinoides]|uniref:LOW QUALITY PROTEIN: cortactin-binding protein 2-like n=1 Tax=Megalops cyprinoides TaxID=118141 RepID=UPI00186546D8|nr:LOW QUALITY PROTEIN: cortactin-binding protein 2-like [Megalops cyprinoides]
MATEGASGEKPPPVQALATAAHGSVEAKCEFNMDSLSKPELLTLLSIMEGELEARDLVIEALRARRKEVFVQERYACFSLSDPFMALQRDCQGGGGGGAREGRGQRASPIAVLEAVMAHCRRMQEKMSAQLAAAESREQKLEQEKAQLQTVQTEHRQLTAQLKEEREKSKHMVNMLVQECRQLAARVLEEGQRFEELSSQLQEEGETSSRLQEALAAERRRGQQMEAEMEKQLSELDVEREQLRARLCREEAGAAELRAESEGLRRQLQELRTRRGGDAPSTAAAESASIAVETGSLGCRTVSCQTELPFGELGVKSPITVPLKPPGTNYAAMSLPKSAPRGLVHSLSGGVLQENGPCAGEPPSGPALPAGVSPRVQAARYRFQEQEQNGSASASPPSRDASPPHRDSTAAKQQARNTVTQVLSRFTSPPPGGTLRPGLPHSTSEGGPFPGRLPHPHIGLKSPAAAKIDRGNPPPIPPKKPGLSQTPSPPHPPVSRSPSGSVGVPPKPATPQLPPKPAVEVAGAGGGCPSPAVTASQVGARPPQVRGPQRAACAECPPPLQTHRTYPVSASPRSPCDPGSPLAAASGWDPPIAPPSPGGDPVPLVDGRTLLQAATQGNLTVMSLLLHQDPPQISHPHPDANAALFSAARNGHADCVQLLLAAGASADAPDADGFTPLHTAAAHGHARCVELLVGVSADVDLVAAGGQSALFLAGSSGSAECVRVLLNAGADCTVTTADGWTVVHALASRGHSDSLELLLSHSSLQASLLTHTNTDGWTAAHIAASKGNKRCLELLCCHSQQDLELRDRCNRTIHHIATDDCKELLEDLNSYRVLVLIRPGSEEQICTVDLLEDGPIIGTVPVYRETGWEELNRSLTHILSEHFHLLGGTEGGARAGETSLGLSPDSVSCVLIGDVEWYPGQDPSRSPWELIRRRHRQRITVRLKGLRDSAVDEVVYDSLIPLQLLHNYIRLVEQYRNVILHGMEGSCQEYIAGQLSLCVKHRQEAMGLPCDIIRVEVDENLTKDQLVETFINCGFLVPVSEVTTVRGVVVVLEGLERARSLSELLGDLCDSLENRGVPYPLPLLHAQEGYCLHHFQEGGFLIGTLSKPHLQGAELLLQQHFRWVQLRWEAEPVAGLLSRHLRRKLVHKMRGVVPPVSALLWRIVAWICCVWQQLNSCLSRLGTPDALIGPQMFLSCPLTPDQPQAVLRWLSRLWNLVVVPRVEEAVVSRVTVKRCLAERQLPSNKNLNPSQQAVVKAALSVLVNKAILQHCPLPRPEVDKYLSEFQGSQFPLLALGSYKGAGRRKGRDNVAWRRANTSPRKKSSPSPSWSSSCTLREGSLSSNDLHSSRGSSRAQRCVGGVSLVLDDQVDLMQELQTLCSSRSEPDISKIPPSREDFIMFPGSFDGQTPLKDGDKETVQMRTQTIDRCHSSSHDSDPPGGDRQMTRPKSQLPVPSNKNLQQAAGAARARSRTSTSRASGRTRQAPPSNNNHQSQEEVWILDRDLHENN